MKLKNEKLLDPASMYIVNSIGPITERLTYRPKQLHHDFSFELFLHPEFDPFMNSDLDSKTDFMT